MSQWHWGMRKGLFSADWEALFMVRNQLIDKNSTTEILIGHFKSLLWKPQAPQGLENETPVPVWGCTHTSFPEAPQEPGAQHPGLSGAQGLAPQHKRGMELLGWIQQRTVRMNGSLEHLSSEEKLKELGLFSLEKKHLTVDLYQCI